MIKIDENLYEVNECVTIPFASQYWIGKMNNESCPMFYTLADNCCLAEIFHPETSITVVNSGNMNRTKTMDIKTGSIFRYSAW